MATEIVLDPDSKNRYLETSFDEFSDVAALSFDKRPVDTFGLSDAKVVELQKAITDSFSFGDEATRTVAFVRNPSDGIDFGDAQITTLKKT